MANNKKKTSDKYEYTDKVINYLNGSFIDMFNAYRSVLSFDDTNILQSTKTLYSKMDELTRKELKHLGKYIYNKCRKSDDLHISELWLSGFFKEPNLVTKYVYENEVDRKRARLYESVMTNPKNPKESCKTALNLWAKMVRQYADDITFQSAIQAYKDNGVEKVVWCTEQDLRVCTDCIKLDDRVFSINKIPPKPHWGCRCWVMPYKGVEK